ncbi:MAG: NAD(P)/FAD-dependent oxidoreductase [Pseudomarimonas sp.]
MTPHPKRALEPVQGNRSQEKSDVIVIGAGVIGLACAHYLREAGRSVRVLEQTEVGAGSSHGNCGTITPSHAPPLAAPGVVVQALRGMLHADSPLFIRSRFDPALFAWLWRFSQRCNRRDWLASARARASLLNHSRRLLPDLIRRFDLQCEFVESGLVYAFREDATVRRYAAEVEHLQQLGIAVEQWDASRLLAEEPALKAGVAGGMYFPGDACLRPDRYVAELARIVVKGGGVIEAGSKVQNFSADDRQAAVRLVDGRTYLADRVVVATGAWTPQLLAPLGLSIPIQPGKGYSITYSRPALVPRRPLVLKEPSVCVTTWGSGFRLGSTMEFSGYDNRLNRTRLDALRRGAHVFLHHPEGPELQEEWFGWRPMTWDDLPMIGTAPGHPRLFLACGHGMLGVSMSAATGQLLADLVCERPPSIDPQPFSPHRFAG